MRRSAHIILLAASVWAGAAAADSLYDPASFRSLVADKRAHRPGDSVTILIYENSSASTRADTAMHRNNEVQARVGANDRQHAAGLGLNNSFDGSGTVQRSGRLLAQITATVQSVAPNGDLWVRGEQMVEINAERQHIRVEGRVRTLDIADTNTVQSNRLAEARISYVGDGEMARGQRPGWLSKVLVWMGL